MNGEVSSENEWRAKYSHSLIVALRFMLFENTTHFLPLFLDRIYLDVNFLITLYYETYRAIDMVHSRIILIQ